MERKWFLQCLHDGNRNEKKVIFAMSGTPFCNVRHTRNGCHENGFSLTVFHGRGSGARGTRDGGCAKRAKRGEMSK